MAFNGIKKNKYVISIFVYESLIYQLRCQGKRTNSLGVLSFNQEESIHTSVLLCPFSYWYKGHRIALRKPVQRQLPNDAFYFFLSSLLLWEIYNKKVKELIPYISLSCILRDFWGTGSNKLLNIHTHFLYFYRCIEYTKSKMLLKK